MPQPPHSPSPYILFFLTPSFPHIPSHFLTPSPSLPPPLVYKVAYAMAGVPLVPQPPTLKAVLHEHQIQVDRHKIHIHPLSYTLSHTLSYHMSPDKCNTHSLSDPQGRLARTPNPGTTPSLIHPLTYPFKYAHIPSHTHSLIHILSYIPSHTPSHTPSHISFHISFHICSHTLSHTHTHAYALS